MLERFELLVGADNLEKVKKLCVLVVGLGGVGGYTVESLVRSGVSEMILVDFDTISVSNKNRQIIATDETIGMKKVIAFQKRIQSISKSCQVVVLDLFLKQDNISCLDSYKIDYIVDACDTISTKEALILYSIARQIPLISCMGVGNRLDPNQLEIMDLSETNYDPLAKRMRKFLKDYQIHQKITVVSSREPPIRVEGKTISSCSFVPSVAGLLITSHIVRQTIKKD